MSSGFALIVRSELLVLVVQPFLQVKEMQVHFKSTSRDTVIAMDLSPSDLVLAGDCERLHEVASSL